MTSHIEFAASESAALEPTECERWLTRVEKLVGHSLDGDQKKDGYSLDNCVDMFKAGKRPLDAFHTITWRKCGLHKS